MDNYITIIMNCDLNYTTIKIRKDIANTIDNIITKNKQLFYRNRTDFIHDALREHIKTILGG